MMNDRRVLLSSAGVSIPDSLRLEMQGLLLAQKFRKWWGYRGPFYRNNSFFLGSFTGIRTRSANSCTHSQVE